ncbi:cytoskeleton protein RodZ [Vibrio sp. OCN044]|uniref:Cytoskeleton protein RodZ n=1 Tax=Vibrio tetraodonis subsp. pristinus TaxID=2695891 RepID=A0A6L8LRE6_9VIBR|nr:cytoskeleton protein RodZ [Vibrio tetraodonis]MYM57696.1 cytoskeleton protein RodZ [Vibrio tetraodonis subsp. pristinus]
MSAEHTPQMEEETKLEAGTILKQKREELGLTLEQVASRLRLRRSIIENIESNQFESEQVATFTRGYLRSYARVVGIEESVVLCALDDNGEAQHQEHEMQSFSQKTSQEKHDNRIMILTWGISAIIVGISCVWWWQNQENTAVELTSTTEQEQKIEKELAEKNDLDFAVVESQPSSEVQPQESKLVEQPLEEVTTQVASQVEPEKVVKAVDNSKEQAPVEQSKIEPVVSNTPVETSIPESNGLETAKISSKEQEKQPQPEKAAADIVANLLEMSFSDDCWIQVKDSTGKTLATGIKKAGQGIQLSGNPPYKVILGAPENVSITLSSEPIDLSGYTSGKVARFTLP